MKKYLLMAVAFVAAISANAQTEGKNSVEIGFNPFTQTKNTFSIDELKYRHYWGANALRVRVGFGVEATKNVTTTTTDNALLNDPDLNPSITITEVTGNSTSYNEDKAPHGYKANPNFNQTVVTEKNSGKDLNFMFAVGYEREFKVAERVNLFAGAEFFYAHVSNINNWNKTTETTVDYLYDNDGYRNVTTSNSLLEESKKTKGLNAANTLGVNLVGGIDFHVYKGLYLGAELGLGLGHTITGKPATVTEDATFALTSNTEVKVGTTVTKTNVAHNYTKNVENGVTTYSEKKVTTVTGAANQVTTYTKESTTTNPTEIEKKNHRTNFRLYAEPALRIGYRF